MIRIFGFWVVLHKRGLVYGVFIGLWGFENRLNFSLCVNRLLSRVHLTTWVAGMEFLISQRP
jgi:hypothetical protein